MSRSASLRSTAVILGVVALLVIAAGVALLLSDQDSGEATGGVLIRVGAVLGALALALPSIRRPSPGKTALVLGAVVLVLARPALVWAGVLAAGLAWLLGRQRSTADKDS